MSLVPSRVGAVAAQSSPLLSTFFLTCSDQTRYCLMYQRVPSGFFPSRSPRLETISGVKTKEEGDP